MLVVVHPVGQLGGGGGEGSGVEETPHLGLLRHETVGLIAGKTAGSEGLVGGQERIGQHVVYPGGVTGVARRVGASSV